MYPKLALIGSSKDISSYFSTVADKIKEKGYCAVPWSHRVKDDLAYYTDSKPFRFYLYENGFAPLRFYYEVHDFITTNDSAGMSCPEKWEQYLRFDHERNTSVVDGRNRQTWFLVRAAVQLSTPIEYHEFRASQNSHMMGSKFRTALVSAHDPLGKGFPEYQFNVGVIASMGWNSSGWAAPPTREDLQVASYFGYVKEHEHMHEALNFAHEALPAEPDGTFIAYTPSFNRLPAPASSANVKVVFFISTNPSGQRYIVGCYGFPRLGEFERKAQYPLYGRYGWGNVRSSLSDIIRFKNPLPVNDAVVRSQAYLAYSVKKGAYTELSRMASGFNYLHSNHVLNLLYDVFQLNPEDKKLGDLIQRIQPDFNNNPKKPSSCSMTIPNNLILYGPPGTGKTYHTTDLAMKIIGQDTGDHQKNQQLFRALKGEQIEFVTFHQNFSYEDFIQGLRPDTEQTNGQLSFRLRDGIFKRIADKALLNYRNATAEAGQPQLPEFGKAFEQFMAPLLQGSAKAIPVKMKAATYEITRVTDLVDGSIHFTKQSGGTAHTLSVRILKDLYEGKRTYRADGLGIYYTPLVAELQKGAKPAASATTREPLKNFVVVVDEINRANISRVFGELITLIEEDKRYGQANQMNVTLPSGESFTVPPNLYIIGTMNTADRSIALLDVALRRRFKFQGMYPDYHLIPEFGDTLRRINTAIKEKKKSSDLMIGHSFFIGKSKTHLKEIFNQEIIPLLNEYFNGNNAQIREVLAAGGIQVTEDENFQLVCTGN